MCGVIFVVSVHIVNVEKFQYLKITIAIKGLMRQADFLHDRTPGGYVFIDARSLGIFIPKIVVSPAKPW